MIYLDYAATTPLDPRVYEAMLAFLKPGGVHGNPSSDHAPGREARGAVERARGQVAALIGAEPNEIIWTSGATESDNLAIRGVIEFYGSRGRGASPGGRGTHHIVTSRTEHKAVLDTCRDLETRGITVTYLKPGPDGRVAPAQVIEALKPDTVLVSLMWVNNETGVIQDIERLAPQLRERGVLLHVDAAQAAGKIPIDVRKVPLDLMSLSGHKVYGPKGVGALFVRKKPRARLAPQMHGGGHEQGMRSGTLPTHQLVGMGEAYRVAAQELAQEAPRLAALRDRLEARLKELPDIFVNGAGAPRVGTLNVSFAGVEGESLRASLPDLAVSSGSACSSATHEPSYVLRALGRDDELANASLRFSLGRFTTEAEVDAAASRVIAEVRRLRRLASGASAGPSEADGGDAFGYGDKVWRRFTAAARSGAFPGAASGAATTPASKGELRLHLKVESGRVADARFQAYGCPTTIAVGDWLAEHAAGRPVAELAGLNAPQIRSALEIPDERAHCAFLGEDALKAALQAVK